MYFWGFCRFYTKYSAAEVIKATLDKLSKLTLTVSSTNIF